MPVDDVKEIGDWLFGRQTFASSGTKANVPSRFYLVYSHAHCSSPGGSGPFFRYATSEQRCGSCGASFSEYMAVIPFVLDGPVYDLADNICKPREDTTKG